MKGPAVTAPDQHVSVRYLVDDVQAAIDFYTTHLRFTLNTSAAPAFADVIRGPLRLLLSGPASPRVIPSPAAPPAPGPRRLRSPPHPRRCRYPGPQPHPARRRRPRRRD